MVRIDQNQFQSSKLSTVFTEIFFVVKLLIITLCSMCIDDDGECKEYYEDDWIWGEEASGDESNSSEYEENEDDDGSGSGSGDKGK